MSVYEPRETQYDSPFDEEEARRSAEVARQTANNEAGESNDTAAKNDRIQQLADKEKAGTLSGGQATELGALRSDFTTGAIHQDSSGNWRNEEGGTATQEQIDNRLDINVSAQSANADEPTPDFEPGSTPYEMGFRTEAEYKRSQAYGDEMSRYGPHPGSKVPEGTVVVTDAGGDPYLRIPPDKARDPEYLGGLSSTGQGLRIPAKDYGGKEKLLTFDQVNKLNESEGQAKFDLEVKYGLIEKGGQFLDYNKATGEYSYLSPKEVAAQEAYKVDLKKFEADLKTAPQELQDGYKRNGIQGYNDAVQALQNAEGNSPGRYAFGTGLVRMADGQYISRADYDALDKKYQDIGRKNGYGSMVYAIKKAYEDEVKASLKDVPQNLKDAYASGGIEGYEKEIKRLQGEYDKAQERFLKESKSAKAYFVDEGVAHIPGFNYGKDYNADFDKLKPEIQRAVIEYYGSLKPIKLLGVEQSLTMSPEAARFQERAKATAGLIPVVGTAIYWNSPDIKVGGVTIGQNTQRAVNIALDATIVASWIKPGLGAGKNIIANIGRSKGEIKAFEALRAETGAATTPLKKALVKAASAYVDNQGAIRDIESYLAKTEHLEQRAGKASAEGLRASSKRSLTILKDKSELLRQDVVKAVKRFDEGHAARFQDMPREGLDKTFVKHLDNIVDVAFRDIKSPPAIQREIKGLERQANQALKTGRSSGEIANIKMRIAEANYKLGISQSGEAQKLYRRYLAVSDQLSNFKGVRTKQDIVRLTNQRAKLYQKLTTALKKLEIDGFKPKGGRGGGRVILRDLTQTDRPTILMSATGKRLRIRPASSAKLGGGVKTTKEPQKYKILDDMPAPLKIPASTSAKSKDEPNIVPGRLPSVSPGRKQKSFTVPSIRPGILPAQGPKVRSETDTEPATLTAITPKTVSDIKTSTTPDIKTRPRLEPNRLPKTSTPPTHTPPPPITPPPPKLPPPRVGSKDKADREAVLKAGGAIAWYQGKVAGKDRWDTIINPYSSNADYRMILGDPPKGATIVTRGKGASYTTAQVLYGNAPKREVDVDSGFQDISIRPIGRKRIKLDYKPDLEGSTTGDITIGQPRNHSITTSNRRISGRKIRITPPRGRIR